MTPPATWTPHDDPIWLAYRLIELGADFRVHEPPVLVDRLRTIASRVTDAVT